MRPVNLLPPERRPRVAGAGDPKVAWAVIGGLAVLLLLVVFSISLSNKAKTLNDEAVALQAEADKHQSAVALIPKGADQVTEEVRSRTLLVGGLSAVRFPWNDVMGDLSRSIPSDVTLDTINAVTAGSDPSATSENGGAATTVATLTLAGCSSGWVGYSRFLTWLKQMPRVSSVNSNSSAIGTAQSSSGDGEDEVRNKNCGPRPLNFNLLVAYRPHSADLLGLPRPESTGGGASGSTGAAPAGAPAAQTTTPAGG